MRPSPLLRLPAELRSQIWTYAYADQTITINNPNRPFPPGSPIPPRRLTFSLCGPSRGSICPHIQPDIAHIIVPWHQEFHHKSKTPTWKTCRDARPFTHPLVSKQFWAETTAVLLRTATWVFHAPHDLRQVLSSGHAWVPHMRHMVVRAGGVLSVVRFFAEWQGALTWRLLSKLRDLRGVVIDISLDYSPEHDASKLRLDPELLACSTWVKAGVPGVVRAFQQHRLRPADTAVRLGSEYGWFAERVEAKKAEADVWCEALRRLLLVYMPLGAGTSVSERRAMRERVKRRGEKAEEVDVLGGQVMKLVV
jgi:hypothetical protein